ncbi:MAG: hypothetical protein RBT69_01545 [Spirochaetia bacterium]|jgi:Tol biopolymer transport system component|nr:hypothetical protein [Spirochaetia bacterium]
MKKMILFSAIIILLSGTTGCRDTAGDGEEHGRVVFFDSTATELIQINDDGTGYNNFTSLAVSNIYPSLTNSFGRGAEYVAYTTGPDIRLYMFDGSFDGPVYAGAFAIQHISVSPDQKYIAFSDVQATAEYFILDIQNPLTPTLINSSSPFGPSTINWSPDGEYVVFASDNLSPGNEEIYNYKLNGGNLTQLTSGPSIPTNPIWSPRGDKILFLDDDFGYDLLYTMNTDGSDRLQIANHSSVITNPSWSPDGRRVAYIWSGQLFVVDADGYDIYSPNQIAPSFIDGTVWAATQVSWSTYGTKLAVTLNSAGNDDLYIVDPETDDFYMLADGVGDQRNAVWLVD